MAKIILSQEQIQQLVSKNHYPVNPQTAFISRCIDGRYANSKSLPALALPGADAGELAILFATANQYGFSVDKQKAFSILSELVGAADFSFHTDNHNAGKAPGAGCGYLRLLNEMPDAFHLEKEQVDTICNTFLPESIKQGAKETVLEGDHNEGAVVIVKGEEGVLPQFSLETDEGKIAVEVFVYHSTLADQRRKQYVRKLVEEKAVVLYDNLDDEYLFEVMSSTGEDHLLETAKNLAKGLPIFEVTFKDDGFDIEDRGFVE